MASIDIELTKQHFSCKVYRTYLAFLKKHYPTTDWNAVVRSCGLEVSFLENENNWASLEFDRRFMNAIREVVKERNFIFEVGRYSVSREGLGAIVYGIARYAMTLDGLYQSIYKLSTHFNKVTKFESIEVRSGFIKMKVSPVYDNLTPNECETLREAIPYIVENARGYFSSLPMLKDMGGADVSVTVQGNSVFMIEIAYRRMANFRIFGRSLAPLYLHAAAAFLSIALGRFGYLTILQSTLLFAFQSLAVSLTMALLKISGLQKSIFALEDNTAVADASYKNLVDTKIRLERRLNEARAINAISENLVRTRSESEVLDVVCGVLAEHLQFDRTLVFIKDQSETFLEFRAGNLTGTEFEKRLSKVRFQIDIASNDPAKISNVFKNRTSILIEDVVKHLPTLNAESQAVLKASGSTSFICVPIASEKTSYGVMIADTYHSKRELTSDDRTVLEIVGRQLALHLEKEKLVESYRRFVPFELIHLMNCESIFDVKMTTGRELDMCILFCDIRGFTSMSESMRPSDSLAFLNSYFANLAPTFSKHNGVIDKFLGDGIMVLFESSDAAIRAAVDYQVNLHAYNTLNRTGDRPHLKTGLGLHFGKVLLGAVGYETRMSVSVVSDAVNLASRLDGLTKVFGVDTICTDDVLDRCAVRPQCRLIGELAVQGRQNISKVYEVLEHLDEEAKAQRLAAAPGIQVLIDSLNIGNQEAQAVSLAQLQRDFPSDPVVKYYQEFCATNSRKAFTSVRAA